MLETIIFPEQGEKRTWKLFFVGLLYATLSFFIVHLIFSRDVVLSRYSGLLMVLFTILFSIIFIYYTIKLDEEENIKEESEEKALIDNWKILSMFLWLFLGIIIAFSFWQIIFPSAVNFNAQIETYCVINHPVQYEQCFQKYNIEETFPDIGSIPKGNFTGLLINNLYVSGLILVFSIIFGAGAIFFIIWNASIISTVISLSVKYKLTNLPLGLLRFLIHGIPEIAGYLLVAMAGGMTSLALSNYIRKKLSKDNFWKILLRSIYLLIIAVIVLVLAALIEIFITPLLF